MTSYSPSESDSAPFPGKDNAPGGPGQGLPQRPGSVIEARKDMAMAVCPRVNHILTLVERRFLIRWKASS